ncbi:MAG: hypothetical protein WAS73_04225 [Defluviicoccus sp.]
MSNTSTVSPYEEPSESSSVADGVAAGVTVTGTNFAAIASFLCEETELERQVKTRRREARDEELLKRHRSAVPIGQRGEEASVPCSSAEALAHVRQSGVRSVRLVIRDLGAVMAATERLGYRHAAGFAAPIARATSPCPSAFLTNMSGDRLVLASAPDGRVVIHQAAAGKADQVPTLMRQHTLDRVLAYSGSNGLALQRRQLVNGETEIVASEVSGDLQDRAQLTMRLKDDGRLAVEVDRCVGSRCVTLAQEVAAAVGGEVTEVHKKDDYFRLSRQSIVQKVRS